MRRTTTTFLATGLATALTVAAITALAVGVAGGQADSDSATATVETADLTRTISARGTLRASTTWTIAHQADPDTVTTTVTSAAATAPSGGGGGGGPTATGAATPTVTVVTEQVPSSTRVTAAQDIGSVVAFGGVLYTTDDQPTLLLPGATAAWRTLERGVEGDDVAQLEQYLADAGHLTTGVDASFDADTEAAVEAWQAVVGLEVTGDVELGTIVFASTPLTVESVSTKVGATVGDGDAMLVVRSADLVVDLVVGDDLAPHLHAGDTVEVRLPDASTMAATVTVVVDDPDRGRIALASLAETPALTVTPVAIAATRTISLTTSALVVPTEAVVHFEGGVDAVRRDDGTLVPVALGAVSGASVAVTSDELAEGDTIVLP